MSKGSLLCSLVLVQVCIVQLCLISSWQLAADAGQAGGKFLCQDPIGTPRLMSSHGREELDGRSADSIFDEEELSDDGLSAVDEYASDGGGGVPAEEEEGWLPGDDRGGGAKGRSSGSGGDVECPECGKFFKNDKSMFGHLRSHPNRGYRGATPPVNKLKLSPETAAASPSSPSRSRGTHQPSAQRDPRLTPLELLLTYAMLTSQHPENSQSPQQAPPPPLAPPPSLCESKTNVGVIEHGVGTSNMAAAEAHADQYGASTVKIPKKRRNMLKEIREAHGKKAKLVSLPPPAKEKGPYICKHCNAEFSTHQALGGHMAGHHRDKKVQTLNDASSRAHQGMAAQSQDVKLQVRGVGDDDDGWRDSALRRGLPSEQLSMASKVPRKSGQASGAQMIQMRQQHSGRRSHALTLAAPAPGSTPTQADDRGGRRPLNIDLNAEATEQE